MSDNAFRINRGVCLNPQSAAPVNPTNGDIYFDSTLNTFVFYENGFWISLADRVDVASAANLTSTNFNAAAIQASLIRITGSTASNLNGLTASTDGKQVIIYNQTNVDMTLKNESATEGTAQNRIVTYDGGNLIVGAGQTVTLVYDGGQSRWIPNGAVKNSFSDTLFSVVDTTDPTKQIKFDAAGIAGTSTTIQSSQTVNRTITMPDLTGTLLTADGQQVITNKDVDGGTASNTSRITLPKETYANLDTLTDKEGTVAWATDRKSVYVNDGTNWVGIGSGGAGDPGAYAFFDADTDVGVWTTGNSIIFGASGSLVGTWTQANTITPLNGLKDYKYTFHASNSCVNDWVASPIINVPLRSRGVDVGIIFPMLYNGADNNIKWIVYDVTNGVILNSSPIDYIKYASGVVAKMIVSTNIPITCTQIKVGFQVLVQNNSKVFEFDDILVTDNPFIYKNLVDKQEIFIQNASSANTLSFSGTLVLGSFGTRDLFTESGTPTVTGSNILIKGFVSGSTGIKYTAQKDCIVNGTFFGSNTTTTSCGFQVSKFNAAGTWQHTCNNTSTTETAGSTSFVVPFSYSLKAGEYIVFTKYGNVQSDAGYEMTVWAESLNIITVAKTNATEVAPYIPNFTGFGTVSNVNFTYWRVLDTLYVKGKFTVGTPTGVEGRISLPSGCTVDVTKQLNNIVGMWNRNAILTSFGGEIYPTVLALGANQYITMSYRNSTYGGITSLNGNALMTGSEIVDVWFSVPILEWKNSSTTFLAALPVQGCGAIYTSNAGNNISSIKIFNYEDVVYDPFNAVTVGSNWNFTCPKGKAGLYHIDFACYNGVNNNTFVMYFTKNGIVQQRADLSAGLNGDTDGMFFGMTYLNEGDYISPYIGKASAGTCDTSSIYTYINIFKVGV